MWCVYIYIYITITYACAQTEIRELSARAPMGKEKTHPRSRGLRNTGVETRDAAATFTYRQLVSGKRSWPEGCVRLASLEIGAGSGFPAVPCVPTPLLASPTRQQPARQAPKGKMKLASAANKVMLAAKLAEGAPLIKRRSTYVIYIYIYI